MKIRRLLRLSLLLAFSLGAISAFAGTYDIVQETVYFSNQANGIYVMPYNIQAAPHARSR